MIEQLLGSTTKVTTTSELDSKQLDSVALELQLLRCTSEGWPPLVRPKWRARVKQCFGVRRPQTDTSEKAA